MLKKRVSFGTGERRNWWSYWLLMEGMVQGLCVCVCVCVCVCGCGCVYCCMYQKYLGQFPRKLPHGYIIKCYKNASRLNRYNFPTVNAIDFLFSTLHTISFHCGVANFGALQQFFADATRSDTPWGSKQPHLQIGAFKSLQIQYVGTGVLLLLMCSVC